MLIKFDKIKYLEDYYNLQKVREKAEYDEADQDGEGGDGKEADQIRLYVEIDEREMINIAE